MGKRAISGSGLVIAVIGFVLTRFTVTLAAMDTATQFLFAGIVPLVLGLGLSAFGVIVTVGAYDVRLVRTMAVWCVIGTGTMAILVVLTLLGSQPDALTDASAMRDQTYLSNFLIGGAIGGTLTGLYAARTRRQQTDLRQQANRLVLLNRLLRDQVINAATAIKGHTAVLEDQQKEQSVAVVSNQADNVIEIVENVKYLSGTADKSEVTLDDIDLVRTVEQELDALQTTYPDAAVECSRPDQAIEVRANGQLGEVFRHLFDNAVTYSEATTPELSVDIETSRKRVLVHVSDDGPGLPENQQALLERGDIAEFDDPTSGFGLNIVRLLVESFEGDIRTTVTEEGSTITVELPRTGEAGTAQNPRRVTQPGVEPSRIAMTIAGSLVAGVAMGLAMSSLGGNVPVIGGLYGIQNVAVAVITHEFHSIVFGLVYAGILSAVPLSYARGLRNRVGIGIGLGLGLWLFAAGLVMPLWLQLVGIETQVPNLALSGLVGHTVWGGVLALLYHAGDTWLTRTTLPVWVPNGVRSQGR